jgi:ribosomal protein L40E
VGLPLIGIGASVASYGYMGALIRYQMEEAAPAAQDTFNQLARGTSGGVQTIARAVARGLSGRGGGPSKSRPVACEKCNTVNGADAKFCHQCGTPVAQHVCVGCGSALMLGARFCGQCGKVVG